MTMLKSKENMKRSKVLVVDDLPTNVKLITAILKRDYEIIPAYSGEEALEKVDSENPDIVLLDIMMPGIDGYEVCKIIKQGDSTRFTPVVMITALSDVGDRIKAIEVDADDFLTKPINTQELITRTRSLLKAKHFHDQLVKSKAIIEAQNDFRAILTNLLPFLFRSIDSSRKTEVIRQMSEQVELFLWAKHIQKQPENMLEMAQSFCILINKLGATFSIDKMGDKGFMLLNTKCPWGDTNINPMFCILGKAILTRVGLRLYSDISVDIEKTIAAGDNYCFFKVLCIGDNL
ncbi:MAG: response regulator [ANME-2 cluster archaeon]|nr:response regulator [ANME-2 cluster archaeon]MBC2701978.1 response regulator [ANME-2 cluster archaeon]MBC2708959.1 response regulator [ANME-2 cluster archaeon]MBC2745775.1 response regulator [ANME-2 cluster archaeon]MBC2764005.1 response regulator [ANME-2 cluster archaeon]